MEKKEITNKPKEPKVEIVSIEIIPDEDEIREIAKIKKKIERQLVTFFLSGFICIVCILCMIFIKSKTFFAWSTVISAIIAIDNLLNAFVNKASIEPGDYYDYGGWGADCPD